MKAFVTGLTMTVWVLGAPLVASAQGRDAGAPVYLAQRARTCNPQQECLARIEGRLKGPALDAARKDCQRMPTSGKCFGPDVFDAPGDGRKEKNSKKK